LVTAMSAFDAPNVDRGTTRMLTALPIGGSKEGQMLVERFVWKAKWQCDRQGAAALKQFMAEMNQPGRVYVTNTGPRSRVITEMEFQDQNGRRAFWQKVDALPDRAARVAALAELFENDTSSELLILV
jgi:hypothetical protein